MSEDIRVAIVELTNIMRDRLIKYPTVLSEPKFSVPNSVIPGWNLGSSYLGVFADTDDRTGKRNVIGLGILVPRKKDLSYERPATINDFRRIEPSIEFERLYTRLGKRFADALNEGPSKSDARSRRLIAALRAEAPYLSDRLDDLVSRISPAFPSGQAGEVRHHEKDGVNTLLRAFGQDHEILRESGTVSPNEPYLMSLPDETGMIDYDSLHFRDWIGSDTDPPIPRLRKFTPPVVAARSFGRGDQKLIIYNANNGRVEDVNGVDLMYYNTYDKNFVMVQYKKFAPEESNEVVRPDDRLYSQLARMKKIDDKCSPGTSAADIRLHAKPCFLKLCHQENPADSIDMIRGMYLSREHFELILNSPAGLGPRGGRRVNEITPSRHLDNNTFTWLLAYGWIGSCGTGSDFVREQVWKSLQQRGAVILGMHVGERPLGNGYARWRTA
jgi:hypothetical protein